MFWSHWMKEKNNSCVNIILNGHLVISGIVLYWSVHFLVPTTWILTITCNSSSYSAATLFVDLPTSKSRVDNSCIFNVWHMFTNIEITGNYILYKHTNCLHLTCLWMWILSVCTCMYIPGCAKLLVMTHWNTHVHYDTVLQFLCVITVYQIQIL